VDGGVGVGGADWVLIELHPCELLDGFQDGGGSDESTTACGSFKITTALLINLHEFVEDDDGVGRQHIPQAGFVVA